MSNADSSTERPASFREVIAGREFKAVFGASALSWFGDYAARAAVTALVYVETESVVMSAATFAISYLPWLGIGNILTAVVERYSYRKVMILCDVLRMLLMAFIALVDVPVAGLMALLFLTAMLNPPFDAARSALTPQILEGDRYVVGISLQKTSAQVARILGYIAGGSIAAYNARDALLLDALTFAISAILVAVWVRERPPALRAEERRGLFRETAEGFGIVYRNRVLRAIALTVFGSACFSVAPEGLGAAWAAELTQNPAERGWYQGSIMMSNAIGFVVGGLLITRLVPPLARMKLIRPFAVVAPMTLVPALFNPGIEVIIAMNVACGFAIAGLLPASNGLFVQALPNSFRARAFGVMQSGLHLTQGAAILATGWLADRFELAIVIGAWSVAGVVIMVLLVFTWPPPASIADTLAAVRASDRTIDLSDARGRATAEAAARLRSTFQRHSPRHAAPSGSNGATGLAGLAAQKAAVPVPVSPDVPLAPGVTAALAYPAEPGRMER